MTSGFLRGNSQHRARAGFRLPAVYAIELVADKLEVTGPAMKIAQQLPNFGNFAKRHGDVREALKARGCPGPVGDLTGDRQRKFRVAAYAPVRVHGAEACVEVLV